MNQISQNLVCMSWSCNNVRTKHFIHDQEGCWVSYEEVKAVYAFHIGLPICLPTLLNQVRSIGILRCRISAENEA